MYRKIVATIVIVLFLSGCDRKTKEELFNEGMKLIKEGNSNGAIVLFKNAIEKDQNYSDARYQLAKAYMSVGKFEQAEKEFQKVLRQEPSRNELQLELAKLYNYTNKPDQAISKADDYLKTHPDSAEALEIIGIGHALNKQPDKAEKYLLQAASVDPARVSAKLELVKVYVLKDDERNARALLDEIIAKDGKNTKAYYLLATLETSRGNQDKALQAYQKIAGIQPSDANAQYRLGMIYLDQKDMDKAERVADDLIKRFPKHYEGFSLKGFVHYHKKNFNEAITELQNSLKIRQTPSAYYFLGLSHYSRGETELALSQFQKVLDANPSFAQARLMKSITLLKQKRFDDSIAEARRVIEADDRNALARNILGSAYLAKGMYDEGMKELNRATELDPKIIDAHLKKGLFHLSKGKTKEGEAELQAAVQVAPEILNTRLLLASYHMRQKNYAKTMSVLNQGISGEKSDAVIYNNMAAVMFAQNKQADGLKYLQKAKNTDPAFFPTYFNIATYYASSGDHEKALGEYRSILQKDPQNVKAMLNTAALLELKGRDGEAFDYYKKAKETKNGVAFLALAKYHMKKRESGKALAVLDEAIKLIPRNAAALEVKGRILVEEKKFKAAIKVFDDIEEISPDQGIPLKIKTYVMMKDIPKAQEEARRIIALKPNSAYGHMMLASVYESQNDLTRAIDEMKNGLRVDGKNVQAILALGNLYVRKKDYKSAMAAYEDALRKNPNFAPALFAQGVLLDLTGKKKEAISKYRETLTKSENFVPALNNLAYLYADGYGSPQEALRLAVAGFKLEPGSPGIMDTLGYALLKNGRKGDALKVLEKAVAHLPNNPTVNYHLALAYRENGMRDPAVKTLQKSLTLGEFPEAGSAKKLLAELKR